ncbi:hypothetical protein [Sulfuricurvum sp.]|uniref:hypothetical protein n=1 Tax=Sulfuricurvum sp. TaxID=2025608 RepID=UPI003BB4FF63
MLKKIVLSVLCAMSLMQPLFSAQFDQKIAAQGSAIIEADVETTQNVAFEDAKKNVVLSALSRLLGYNVTASDEALSAHIGAMVSQFDTYAKILSKTPSRDGATFIIALNVSIDEKALRALMKDEGIGLTQKVREAGSIVLLFDESEKPYDQPSEMFNEYLHYSKDKSHLYDERHTNTSDHTRNALQSGVSNTDMNASSSNTQQDNHVQNSSSKDRISDHLIDQEEYTYSKNYAGAHEMTINSGYVKSQLQKTLKQYGLDFIDGSGKLSEFNQLYVKHYLSYNDVLESEDSSVFKEFIKKATGAEFMALAYSQINYSMKPDETTGKFGCTTTQSNVSIFSLKDSKLLDSGSLEAVQLSERSIEACKSNARFDMADNLGHTIGLGIQKTIRDAERTFISGPVHFKVTIEGSFDRKSRKSLESILDGSKKTFKSYQLITQSKDSIQYDIVYEGSKNIGDVILDAVESSKDDDLKDQFDGYDFKLAGQNTIVLYRVK